VVLVETVGIGQSEALAAEMVDTLCVLLLAGGGDGLQGIKRGVLELADVLAVTKADGGNEQSASQAAAVYRSALQLFRPRDANWRPPIQTLSAHSGLGVGELWDQILAHRAAREAAGTFESHRRGQRLRWLWTLVEEGLHDALTDDPRVATLLHRCKGEVEAGLISPGLAARRLLRRVLGPIAAPPEES
jgi:LAO/AO transport system kinase